ncbi:MAG: hypothetical protein RLZZ373_3343 [Pseudomonadota bacterium]|jgi:uncharacterized protein YoxC
MTMTPYEIIVTSIATVNLVLTLSVMVGNRRKAGDQRVAELEKATAAALKRLENRLARVEAITERALTHDDLEKTNARIDELARVLHHLAGTVEQVNNSQRAILNKMMRTPNTGF